MTTAWTAEQIAALAPDAASLTAARKLRGKWSGSGAHGDALWGLCAGSGSRPYQTVIDTSGPAYKCSCPSRKFPCKHALSLLLSWAEGNVPATGAPADFAAEWLAGRAAREAKKAAPAARPTGAAPARDGGASADQRRARVAAGLADLDIWLTDQVRTGLAQTDRSALAFETVAARMVDAQAPGVAATLRHLPRAATGADWPQVLLREYARLHLLSAAHARSDELEPSLRASVRAHIGYQVPAESVHTEPAVRDRWLVLGQHVTSDEALYTRRIWLRGRETGRWALLIDHHHGSPSFPPDTPLPGFQVDAELHFYPSAAPLRALWGARHAAPEPFTTIPRLPIARNSSAATDPGAAIDAESGRGGVRDEAESASAAGSVHAMVPRSRTAATDGSTRAVPGDRPGNIAAALLEYAAAIGADPFLRSWPVLLAEVVPVRDESGWYVVESDGAAVPIAPGDGEPWKLLGLSGGHPVTVVGEWSAGGLIPVAALHTGIVTDVAVAERSSAGVSAGRGDSAMTELVSAALVGTARRQAGGGALPAPVAALSARLTGEPAALLLETIALQDCFARGAVTAGAVKQPDPAQDDDRLLLPRGAGAHLAELLGENSPFLDEWFAAAATHDFRAPDELCSLLLDRAKSLSVHRESLLALAGARGRWLAAQHPGWRSLVRAPVDDESVWSHGRPAERRLWLAQLRARDRHAALAALAGSWGTESGPGKAELLLVLADGLGLGDEAMLETALDDRRAEVRRTAADLLGRLPDSTFAGRMAERAGAWLSFGPRLRQPVLTTTGPGVLDEAARRDGVGDSYGYTAYRAEGAPDLAAEWLHRVVAGTPLRHWERVLGSPEQAVRVAMSQGMRGPMFAGWSDATLAQRDSAWAKALFGAFAAQEAGESDSEKLRELFALQPLDDQIRHLRRLDSSWLAEIESLLRAVPHPWPAPMAEHVLRLLLERAQLSADRPGAPSLVPGSYRTLFRASSAHFPVTGADMVSGIARRCGDPYWEQAFDQLAHDLIQRKTMLEELQ
ncbi:DUF5691 domain-containing protein [Nocardia sp. NPDC057668]|uniref:DUF5691 domain-containing protein n=1 Tax=Nocardia sp. NPDC057668 TaxID=3346202 RepID=UPI00366EA4F9